jgi:flagellar biosynthesis GTPase FlhF
MNFYAPKHLEYIEGMRQDDRQEVKVTAGMDRQSAGQVHSGLRLAGTDFKGNFKGFGKGAGKGALEEFGPSVHLAIEGRAPWNKAAEAQQAQAEEDRAAKEKQDREAKEKEDREVKEKEEQEAKAREAADKAEAERIATEEKNQKKAERDKMMEKLKKTPRYQGQKWLNGVTKLVTKKGKKLPAGTDKTYRKKFEDHSAALTTLEAEIRALLQKRELRIKLIEGHKVVDRVKEDLKAFNLLYRGYYKDG